MNEEAEPEGEPEAELELIGTNFFKILSEECLLHIFNSIELDTYSHRELYQNPVEWSSTSYKSLARLSVCCQDFNTLLKDRIAQSKTIYTVEKKIKKPFSEAVNLQELYLRGNQISDITPLSALVNLEALFLGGHQISDITPLSALVNLQHLVLGYNQISDITPLSALVRLTSLDLAYNQISDITPLSALVNLQRLDLRYNQISDRTPLDNLKAGGCDIKW